MLKLQSKQEAKKVIKISGGTSGGGASLNKVIKNKASCVVPINPESILDEVDSIDH